MVCSVWGYTHVCECVVCVCSAVGVHMWACVCSCVVWHPASCWRDHPSQGPLWKGLCWEAAGLET